MPKKGTDIFKVMLRSFDLGGMVKKYQDLCNRLIEKRVAFK